MCRWLAGPCRGVSPLLIDILLVLHLLDKLATSDALLGLDCYHMLSNVLVYIEVEMKYMSTGLLLLLFLVCS